METTYAGMTFERFDIEDDPEFVAMRDLARGWGMADENMRNWVRDGTNDPVIFHERFCPEDFGMEAPFETWVKDGVRYIEDMWAIRVYYDEDNGWLPVE